MAFDPNYQPFAQTQAAYQFGSVDPLGYLARIRAMQQGQGQNEWASASGTTSTDLAKLIAELRKRKMLESLQSSQSSPGMTTDNPFADPSWTR